jgi:hypothetical protein
MTRAARALVLCCYGLIGAAWLLPSSEPRPAAQMTAMPAPTSITPKPITPAPAVVAAPAAPAAPAVTLTGGTAYKAGELPLAFTPADMWAYTVLQDHPLPPLEYDHAHQGPVVVFQATDQADMKIKCNRPDILAYVPVFGCSWAANAQHPCLIVVADDATITRWGWTRNIVLRHEIGHCNGWPQDHAGAR